jgi:hypothetical protein
MELHSDCINDYLLNRKDQWTCPVKKFVVKEPIWKQLTMDNTWLINSQEQIQAAITCNGIRHEIKIKDIAILKIHKGCIITTRDNIILSKQQSSISVHSTYQKPARQMNFDNITVVKPHDPVKITPIISLEDSYIPDQVGNEIRAMENTIIHHQIMHHAASSICIIGIIIIIYIAWSYRTAIRKQIYRTRPVTIPVQETELDSVQHGRPAGVSGTYIAVPEVALVTAPTASKRTWPTSYRRPGECSGH